LPIAAYFPTVTAAVAALADASLSSTVSATTR